MIQFDKICFACSMPSRIERTGVRGELQMHCETGFAIEWPDGYGQHYLYGVFFDPKLFKKVTSKKIKAKDILSLSNIDQRMAALKLYGPEKLLESVQAELIDRSEKGNMLYKIENVFPATQYALKYNCPSTNRQYISFVRPEIGEKKDADFAMASKWPSLTKQSYLSLTAES